ncbi:MULTISPECIES: recombinase family protein [Bacillus cereus group]|uniref:recombinase family protein n=1 Tax=Bacillus cereus group TaxID=86661 RepID=UPI00123BA162|nr:recombinase family protein [Bacillus cereus]KAA6469482.1 recombinase family protein [Bacillus cereus]KAA6470379.1 recombinase family protein [Bacillus cereus]KAB2393828.1 recombinase family protein [Bacillus cereus]KAB2417839.1 recombinase family protein [Bacillus cereus]KAB2421624.1 recombinase family protein [Bacillus cereus]
MKVGYVRVSTIDQNLDLQIDALKSYGCDKIFQDKLSGVKDKRPGLEEALQYVRPGDSLVVWRLDRLGRTMRHLIQIVNELNERGISFYSVQESITMDRSSATGQLMFHLFASFAEFERNLIRERTEAGRVAARARGRFGGRPEKLKDKEIDMIQTLVANKTPIKDVAQMLGVSRTTVYRYLNK